MTTNPLPTIRRLYPPHPPSHPPREFKPYAEFLNLNLSILKHCLTQLMEDEQYRTRFHQFIKQFPLFTQDVLAAMFLEPSQNPAAKTDQPTQKISTAPTKHKPELPTAETLEGRHWHCLRRCPPPIQIHRPAKHPLPPPALTQQQAGIPITLSNPKRGMVVL